MKQTREIKHGDGHIDIETLFGGVWAVTKCNLEATMTAQYTVSYYHRNPGDPQGGLEIQRESITAQNAQEAREIFEDNDMEIVEVVETRKLVDTLYAKIDELEAMVANLNEGAKIMHAFATGGESKLLADWKDEATNSFMAESQAWKDEALSAEQADLAERASGCWASYTPSAKELSKRVQPEIKEAQEVADNFNFNKIKPIKF